MRLHLFAALLFLPMLTGCQSAMTVSNDSRFPPSGLPDGSYTNVDAPWPLQFRSHYFGAYCFDTRNCEVLYRGFSHGAKDGIRPSVEPYGRPLEKLLRAGRGPIPNFPPPAKVSWRSKDGTSHEADIDIGEIFKDQLIRHRVAREDASEPATDGSPGIILEVNDRTINVYMKAMIWTKEEQIPGNRHSQFRNDLIKVYSRTY